MKKEEFLKGGGTKRSPSKGKVMPVNEEPVPVREEPIREESIREESQQPQQPQQPQGIYLSNEAWGKVIADLSMFKPIVVESVAKVIQQHGELKM